jgi:hypothetical protein
MISRRLGIIVAIVIGSVAGGGAGATILRAADNSAAAKTASAPTMAYVAPPHAPSSMT